MKTMRYVLGIDQGGTKTHALIADETGHLLGLGEGMGSCHASEGMDHAMEACRQAVFSALQAAGLTLDKISCIAAGMTGVDWPDEAGLLQTALSKSFSFDPDRIHVVNDCIIALRAASSSSSGCILCVGTGTNCAARDGRGGEYVFGYYVPDEDQGGDALARRILRAIFDAESGMGPATSLTGRILALSGCLTVDDLLRAKVEQRLAKEIYKKLPIIAGEEAISGDPVSAALLEQFGRDTAAYAVAALRRLGLEKDSVDVILSGSVFKCNAPVLLETVKKTILAAAPTARIRQSLLEPAAGAVLLALDDLGIGEPEVLRQVEQDAPAYRMIRR